jgi:hypothetical protein
LIFKNDKTQKKDMKNSINIWCIVLFTLIASISFAQDKTDKSSKEEKEKMHAEKREKIDSAKTAFITERLSLTPAQSEKFFPLYKEYNDKRKALRKERGALKSQSGNLSATDEQLKADMNKLLDLRQKEVNLDKEYFDKFQKVISIRQVAELYHSESLFTRELIKNFRGDKGRHPRKQ